MASSREEAFASINILTTTMSEILVQGTLPARVVAEHDGWLESEKRSAEKIPEHIFTQDIVFGRDSQTAVILPVLGLNVSNFQKKRAKESYSMRKDGPTCHLLTNAILDLRNAAHQRSLWEDGTLTILQVGDKANGPCHGLWVYSLSPWRHLLGNHGCKVRYNGLGSDSIGIHSLKDSEVQRF